MICYACQNGTLTQKYPDTIECPQCGSKWKNYSLGGSRDYGRGSTKKQYYAAKHKAGRQF